MTTLNLRAQSIRAAAASALDDQQRDDIVMRAAGFVRKLEDNSKAMARARQTIDALVGFKVIPNATAVTPPDSYVRKLIAQAEERVEALPEFLQSGLPGDVELGVADYRRLLEDAAKNAWALYAGKRAASLGAASELLEKALGSLPRFVPTIERVRLARGRINLLKARELPTTTELEEFEEDLETLEEANKEFEREVPPEYQDALRRCASPSGLRPADLPDGFVDWIDEIGASSYFKVTLSHL